MTMRRCLDKKSEGMAGRGTSMVVVVAKGEERLRDTDHEYYYVSLRDEDMLFSRLLR